MVGSEVFSGEVKKTEILASGFRRAIGELRHLVWVKKGGLSLDPEETGQESMNPEGSFASFGQE